MNSDFSEAEILFQVAVQAVFDEIASSKTGAGAAGAASTIVVNGTSYQFGNAHDMASQISEQLLASALTEAA